MTLVDCLRNYLVGKRIEVAYPYAWSKSEVAGEVIDVQPDSLRDKVVILTIKSSDGETVELEVELDQSFTFLGYR
jgi:hypothetical protein